MRYICKIKLNQLWGSHLCFITSAIVSHSNRSSVLLLSEWSPYPKDSASMKNNIVNLSNTILTTEQTIMLDEGLPFCPSKTKLIESTFVKTTKSLSEKSVIIEYHQSSDRHPAKETPLMKTLSNNWTLPSGRNVHVDSFVDDARTQCCNVLNQQ